jgi:hypothetical protein
MAHLYLVQQPGTMAQTTTTKDNKDEAADNLIGDVGIIIIDRSRKKSLIRPYQRNDSQVEVKTSKATSTQSRHRKQASNSQEQPTKLLGMLEKNTPPSDHISKPPS